MDNTAVLVMGRFCGGMGDCLRIGFWATTIPKYAADSPSPRRPFLRKQESHNKMRQRRVESANGGNNTKIRHRFPVPRKTIPAKAGIYSSQGGIAALITPPLAAHGCEIPAYAGMVCGGTGVCGCILAGIVDGNLAGEIAGVLATMRAYFVPDSPSSHKIGQS